MIQNMLITLVVALIVVEIIEHVLVPLIGLIFGKKRRSISGAEGMVGQVVEVKRWKDDEGEVFVNGELWRAVCMVPLVKGDKAVIHDVEGLLLKVEPLNN